MRRIVLVWMLAAASALAAPAPGQPRMRPFLPIPGLALGGNVAGATFCDAAARAVLRLDNGDLVTLDAAGTLASLGNAGVVPMGAPMVCDRTNRIWMATGKQLTMVAPNGTVKVETLAVGGDLRYLRVLDDDTLALVDIRGTVYRFGATLDTLWTSARSQPMALELDSKAERILNISAGRVEVTSATGTVQGPMALSTTWLDDSTVLFADRTGRIARWSITAPSDQTRFVAQTPPRGVNQFVRTLFQRAGARRIIVSRGNEGPLLVLAFDARAELARTTQLSRIPGGRRLIASGESAFAFVTANDRAFVIGDVTKPAFVVDHEHPLVQIDGLGFSPDGRALAVLGGDRDLLVYALDHRTTCRRLEAATPFVRAPIRWFADGSLLAGTFGAQIRWNPDGTVEERRDRALGFTELGNPITFDARTMQLAIDRGHSEQRFTITDRTFGVSRVDLVGRFLMLRGSRRVELHDLGLPLGTAPRIRTTERQFLREAVPVAGPAVMYLDDVGALFLADGKSDRQLAKFAGTTLVSVAADGKRMAVANKDALSIYNDRGALLEKITARGMILAIAWSPDLHTLAMATRDGVDLWTFPR